MDVFKKIGDLAVFLDDELHRIEASYRIILESSRRYEGAAEIACDIREEIQNLNRQIDSLIVKAEDQHEDFQRFLDNMTETIEKFDEKINKVENYAAKYGYIKPDGKEKIDLRKSLQEVGKQQPSGFEAEAMVEINDEKEDHHMDSPNLLHMGLSKQTLETLGITLGKKTVNNVENVEHQVIVHEPIDDCGDVNIQNNETPKCNSSEEDSPPKPILKKNHFKPKLNASVFDHSQVEISPGLFVKRPSSRSKNDIGNSHNDGKKIQVSSKLKHEDKIEPKPSPRVVVKPRESWVASNVTPLVKSIVKDDCLSPELPQLKTIDLAKIIQDGKPKSSANSEIDETTNTPEMPDLQSECGKLLSTKKTYPNKTENMADNKENQQMETPELPHLNSYEANLMLSQKKVAGKTGSPVKIQDEIPMEKNNLTDDCLSPELPHLKTVNLQSLLREKGTVL